MHNQLGAHAAGAVDSAGGAEAKPKVDTTVTVLSAMDGREDIAQMARRLAADVAALSREPEVGQRGQGSPKVDEELVSAQLRGNPALHCFGSITLIFCRFFAPSLPPLLCLRVSVSAFLRVSLCVCTRGYVLVRVSTVALLQLIVSTVYRGFIAAYNTSTSGGGAQSVLETDGPDLLMRFTPGGALRAALTTDGFPPWYLRLTEIQYASHLRLTEQSCD
jgi:hypothetical protein